MCDDLEDAEAAASDLEDLLEQLTRQDEVYRGLREEIARETEKGDEYRELLAQLQKNGRFLKPAATLGAVGKSTGYLICSWDLGLGCLRFWIFRHNSSLPNLF